jgi:hypothetical protein
MLAKAREIGVTIIPATWTLAEIATEGCNVAEVR